MTRDDFTLTFKAKEIEVEANQWFEFKENEMGYYLGVKALVGEEAEDYELCSDCVEPRCDHGWLRTSTGGFKVCPGDWVVTLPFGDRYPMKPSAFEEMFERALVLK